MKNLIILLWVAFVGLCSYKCNQCCGTKAPNKAGESNVANSFTVSNGSWKMTCPAGKYIKSQTTLLDSQETTKCFEKISEYQNSHPNQNWLITGNYGVDEANNSIYANLGEARAKQIKNILVSNYGINSKNVQIQGQLSSADSFVVDTLINGYLIAFGNQTTDDNEYQDRFDRSKPIALRFDTGSSTPNINAEIRAQFANLLSDLEEKPDEKVMVIGHTDSQGDAANNLKLGEERAETIKKYLVSNGISADRILTQSKGETEPISENDAQNRRVEVTLLN